MIKTDDFATLVKLLGHSIEFVNAERVRLNQSVLHLEKQTREPILDRYGHENAWRGLASDSFIGMVDSINSLVKA